jgi:hypothetical protein
VRWDENLDSQLGDWLGWMQELNRITQVNIVRCYWPPSFVPSQYTLHIFVDASEKAFAAVCYIQMISTGGEIHNSLVIAKTRVAPLKSRCLTLPRLELQAAVLGVRVQLSVVMELKLEITAIHFWSDSLIVLHYIRNDDKRLKTFVANRVSEIRQHSDPDQWHYVPGYLNPADDGTRGLTVDLLTENHRWFRGPEFLWNSVEFWPSQDLLEHEVDCANLEVKQLSTVVNTGNDSEFIQPADYSSLSRLLRTAAWCFRFLHNARTFTSEEKKTGPLIVNELKAALLHFVKKAQAITYSAEIAVLDSGDSLPRNSPLVKLIPELVDGLLRVGGRLDNACLPFETRHQIILPRDSTIAKLSKLLLKCAKSIGSHASESW